MSEKLREVFEDEMAISQEPFPLEFPSNWKHSKGTMGTIKYQIFSALPSGRSSKTRS